jgi:hypothetical protein
MTELISQPKRVPESFVNDPEFRGFFFTRAERFREEMEETYIKVREASRDSLRVAHYPGNEDFDVWVCPVKSMCGNEPNHPILLAYCWSSNRRAELYWPEDMLPLSNEERRYIWYEYVKDDDWYLQLPEGFFNP